MSTYLHRIICIPKLSKISNKIFMIYMYRKQYISAYVKDDERAEIGQSKKKSRKYN